MHVRPDGTVFTFPTGDMNQLASTGIPMMPMMFPGAFGGKHLQAIINLRKIK